MKGLLLSGILLIALADRAAADDSMVTKAPAIPYGLPVAYDWSGFYAGSHIGYGWGSSNWTASVPATSAVTTSGSLDLFQPFDAFKDTGSFFEGVQAGYNFMLPNRLVIGAEADVSFPQLSESARVSQLAALQRSHSPSIGAESYSETVLSFGTVRGRIGYAPGNWLVLRDRRLRLDLRPTDTDATRQRDDRIAVFVAIGLGGRAGVEVPVAPHWTARLEYLFTDYGISSVTLSRRSAADRFRFLAARAARRLELSVRQRRDAGAKHRRKTRDA